MCRVQNVPWDIVLVPHAMSLDLERVLHNVVCMMCGSFSWVMQYVSTAQWWTSFWDAQDVDYEMFVDVVDGWCL